MERFSSLVTKSRPWPVIGRTIFFTSDKNRPTRDEIYFIDFWCENLSMYRINRYLHMWRYHIFTCEDIVSFLSIWYQSLYHCLLYNKVKYVCMDSCHSRSVSIQLCNSLGILHDNISMPKNNSSHVFHQSNHPQRHCNILIKKPECVYLKNHWIFFGVFFAHIMLTIWFCLGKRCKVIIRNPWFQAAIHTFMVKQAASLATWTYWMTRHRLQFPCICCQARDYNRPTKELQRSRTIDRSFVLTERQTKWWLIREFSIACG